MRVSVCQTLPAQSLSCPRPSPTSPRRPAVLPALPSATEAGRSPAALKGAPSLGVLAWFAAHGAA